MAEGSNVPAGFQHRRRVIVANKNVSTSAIVLDTPPRPASGEGAVILGLGNTQVRFTWEDGKLGAVETGVFLADEEMLPPDGESLGVVTCKKCATDSDTGKTVCWPVPC